MSGAYFGDPGTSDETSDLLPLFHAVRNRELKDYEAKGLIDQNLAIRQERMKSIFDPSGASSSISSVGFGGGKTTNNEISHGITAPNTSINTAPLKEDLSPMDKANLQLKKNDQTIDREKIAQQGKLGEERLGINRQQEQLNQQKSDQIHQQKTDDMERKIEESNRKIQLAQDQLNSKNANANDTLVAHKAMFDAVEERHRLELAQKDAQFKDTQGLHQATIDKMREEIENLKNPKPTHEEVKYDDQGRPISKDVTKGVYDSNTTYRMTDKDGKDWMVKHDNLEAAKKSGLTMSTDKSVPKAK